jgi:hypothetical protein
VLKGSRTQTGVPPPLRHSAIARLTLRVCGFVVSTPRRADTSAGRRGGPPVGVTINAQGRRSGFCRAFQEMITCLGVASKTDQLSSAKNRSAAV